MMPIQNHCPRMSRLLLIWILAALNPAAGEELTRAEDRANRQAKDLPEFLQMAAENSPGLAAPLIRIRAAESELEALPRWYFPAIYLEAGYGGAASNERNRSGPLGRIVAEWTLWDGGRNSARRSLLEKEAELRRHQGAEQVFERKRALAFVYYRAGRLIEWNEIAAQEIVHYDTLVRLLGPRLRIGTAAASDILNVRLQIARRRNQMAVNRATIAALSHSLAAQAAASDRLGGEEDLQIPALSRSFAPALDALPAVQDDAVHPYYRQQRVRLQLIEAELEYTKTDLYGASIGVELYGGYGPDRDALQPERPEAGASLRFRVPLLSSGDRSRRLQALAQRLEAERMETEQSLRDIRAANHERRALLTQDQQSLAAQAQLVDDCARNLRLSFDDFRRGQKSPADMLAAIETCYSLKRERLETMLRCRLALLYFYLLVDSSQSGA